MTDTVLGFLIINISNPTNPTLVGSCHTPDEASDLYVSGNYAYVTDRYSGLQIINISNPLNPIIVGSYDTPGYAWWVYISGNYAYVTDWDSGLQIINISNPLNPTLAGSCDTPDDASGVYVSGNYAYVADGNAGLQIIDTGTSGSKLTVSPINQDFNSLKCELETDPQTFTLTNTGASNITISTISLSGTNASEFSIKSDNCSGQSISPSGTATFDVVFSPQTAGNKTATISVASNDPGSPITVPLAGKGVLTTVVKVDLADPFEIHTYIVGNEIPFRADTWGAQSQNLTYKWDLDNDGIKDDSTVAKPSKSWDESGTYLVGVEVTDSVSGEKATNWLYVAIKKTEVANEPQVLHPVINLSFAEATNVDLKFYDSDGNQFHFDSNKKSNGLIIITHGIWASATEATSLVEQRSWLEIMAQEINTRLTKEGKNLPNIALYGWEEMSYPDHFGGNSTWKLDDLKLGDLLLIRPYGRVEGLVLADWIQQQVKLGNIATNAPIHIVGHSAGGFVVTTCAATLGSLIKQITTLDTPYPDYYTGLDYLGKGGKIDAYISQSGDLMDPTFINLHYPNIPYRWGEKYPNNVRWSDIREIVHNSPYLPNGLVADHVDSHEWYKNTVISNINADPSDSSKRDGFYYSPWLGNAFPSIAGQALVEGIHQTMQNVSGTPISVFETFPPGNVSETSGIYTITEGAGNAGI